MAIIFFGNNITSFDRNTISVNTVTTNSENRDTAYTDSQISFSGAGGGSWVQKFLDAPISDFWTHFDHAAVVYQAFPWFTLVNSSGIPVIQMLGASNNKFQFWNGSAWVDAGASFTLPTALARYDIRVTPGASGTITLYQNNALVFTHTGLNAAVNNLQGLRLGSSLVGNSFSQIIIADEDTRDYRVFHRRPNANGFYNSDGAGTFTDVNTAVQNDATSIILPNIGHKRTFAKSAITLPAGYIVKAVGISGRYRCDGTPNDARGLLRIGGVDYVSAAMGISPKFLTDFVQWSVDPATGLAFTESAVNALEFGHEVI